MEKVKERRTGFRDLLRDFLGTGQDEYSKESEDYKKWETENSKTVKKSQEAVGSLEGMLNHKDKRKNISKQVKSETEFHEPAHTEKTRETKNVDREIGE